MHTKQMMAASIKKLKEKKCVVKQKLMFENYKDSLFNNKTIYRSQERFRSYYRNMYTEEVKKVALSSNDDKRLQTFDEIETYLYVTTNEMLKVFAAKENVLKT